MQSSSIVSPTAIQTPFALNGDKNIPNQTASGTETSSINLGFLPITQVALDSGGQAPERVDFNGMFYLSTDQRVFLQNGGLITFDASVSSAIGGYPKGAVLAYIDSSGNVGYVKSKIEDNTQNFITNPSLINGTVWEWVYFNNFQLLYDIIQPIGLPVPTLDFSNLRDHCIWLEGAEVSRITYAALFDIYGTTYGSGNGSTTFNLPDIRKRVLWGGTSVGYLESGLPNIKAEFAIDNRKWISGAVYTSGTSNSGATGDSGVQYHAYFNAHTYNSIYDDFYYHVQPPAIKVRWFTRYE